MLADGDIMELRDVVARLERRFRDLDVRPSEAVAAIDLGSIGWPMPIALQWSRFERRHETRLRWMLEACDLLELLFGATAAVWLRRPVSASGRSPLDYLSDGPDALPALVRLLRDEVERRP